jgi:ABC-type lipoprotein release transport system permease subunit
MIIRLALKNLSRHLRRTILTTLAVTLGTALSLFSLGLGDGGHNQMIENGVRIGNGHLTVQMEGYLDSPSTSLFIADPVPLVKSLEEIEGISQVHPRIRGEGIISTARGSEGVQFLGIDPSRPGEGEIFRNSLHEGEFLSGSGREVVMGAKLAERLKVKLGRKAVITCQGSDGEITSLLVRVKGIFSSGSSSIDSSICLLPIGLLQESLSMGQGVTSISLYLDNPFQQERVQRAVADSLPEGPVRVYPWQVMQKELKDFVVIDDIFAYLTYGIILFIVAIGVLNTILMSVMERKREIGILTALGMEGRSVLTLVMTETALITLIGIAAGLAIGMSVHWYFAVYGLDLRIFTDQEFNLAGTIMDPVMYSQLRAHRVIQLCLVVFFLNITMGLYPAWKASRTLPVEAMEKP